MNPILKNPPVLAVFIVTIFAKLLLSTFFHSQLLSELFHPFVQNFIENFHNPWDDYLNQGLSLDAFPYPPMMLFILSVFTLPIKLLGIQDQLLINFFFKLPTLVADLTIVYLLVNLYPNKIKRILAFYFLNPIVFYASYVHSQLDLIPTCLLFCAVFLLIKKNEIAGALLVGLAILTKTHVITALPLIALFIGNRFGLYRMLRFALIAMGTVAVILLPVWNSQGFYNMVLTNPKQSLIFDSVFPIGKIGFLMPVVAVFFIYFHFFTQRKVNQDLLYFYLGILFCALVLLVEPAPAWYLWIFPYLPIYFIQSGNLKKALLFHSAFVAAYLMFFLFFYQGLYHDVFFLNRPIDLKISNPSFFNLSFSVLETVLVAVMYSFYRFGIQSNTLYKFKTNLIIGIDGDSGAGKSTLMRGLRRILGDDMLEIEGDAEHK